MTRMQKGFLFVCFTLLAVSIAVKLVGDGVAHANIAPQSPHDAATAVGVHLIDLGTLPAAQASLLRSSAVAQSRALEAAQAQVGSRFSDQHPVVESKLYLFTDSEYGPTDANGKIQPLYMNRLVWVVSYEGINFYGSSGPRGQTIDKRPFTEFNVVIDATTGEVLEAYSYQ